MQHTNAPDLLLETARRAIQHGQLDRARAVLRALGNQYPQDVRVWETLADVASDEQERKLVLDQLAAQHAAPATATLADLTEPDQLVDEVMQLPAPVMLMPRDRIIATERAPIRWPTYLVIGLTALVLVALVLWRWFPSTAPTATSEPTQVSAEGPLPTLAAILPLATAVVELPSVQPAPTDIPAVVVATAVSPSVTPLPTIEPTATARPRLPIGNVVQSGAWNITLLRPEHALILDGSIGSLQPQGRFVLALLAIGNTSNSAVRIPEQLVALQDEQGNRYLPIPAASTAYLATYGRGQTGDLSFEEPIPSDAGNLSVPVLFDVPANARGLQIVVDDAPAGWAVAGS